MEAIEVLYQRHYRELVRLVSGLLDDDGECEEIVQEVFVRLSRGAAGHGRGTSSPICAQRYSTAPARDFANAE